MAVDKKFTWGLGRRKSSVARVRIRAGTGTFHVNGRKVDEYFPIAALLGEALSPLQDSGLDGKYDVFGSVNGGGPRLKLRSSGGDISVRTD